MTIKQTHLPERLFVSPPRLAGLMRNQLESTKLPRAPLADILRIEAYGNYVKVYTDMLRRLPAKELPAAIFLRTHKSYVVPQKQTERLATGKQPTVRGGQVPPLGAAFRQDFLRHWPGTVG